MHPWNGKHDLEINMKYYNNMVWLYCKGMRQRSARILDPRNSRRVSFIFSRSTMRNDFLNSQVSISSRNMRITICNLVLVSKYKNGHMIISFSFRQVRARKIILNLESDSDILNSRRWGWTTSESLGLPSWNRRPSVWQHWKWFWGTFLWKSPRWWSIQIATC